MRLQYHLHARISGSSVQEFAIFPDNIRFLQVPDHSHFKPGTKAIGLELWKFKTTNVLPILQIFSDTRKADKLRDVEFLELSLRANSGKLEPL